MQRNKILLIMMITMLILLFTYTAVSKLADLAEFERQLSNQLIPKWSVSLLLWLLPLSELTVVLMLISKSYRLAGLRVYSMMMLAFSIYMGLVVLNVFDRVPCSCGGVLRNMDFATHFIFNLTFLFVSVLSIKLHKSLRMDSTRSEDIKTSPGSV
jgi:putative oxidoreductase